MTGPGVLIVDYRTPVETLECVGTLPADVPVVVVDNDPASPSQRVVWEAVGRRARVLRPGKKIGLSAALNLGLEEITGDVLVLNSDVRFHAARDVWRLFEVLSAEGVGLVAPRLLYPDGREQGSARTFPSIATMLCRRTVLGRLPAGRRVIDAHLHPELSVDGVCPVDWVLGAAMCIDRRALEAVGGFDDSFFLYYEDADLCARLWRAGWKVGVCGSIAAVHDYRRASRRSWALWSAPVRWHLASAIRLGYRYPSTVLWGRPLPRRGS